METNSTVGTADLAGKYTDTLRQLQDEQAKFSGWWYVIKENWPEILSMCITIDDFCDDPTVKSILESGRCYAQENREQLKGKIAADSAIREAVGKLGQAYYRRRSLIEDAQMIGQQLLTVMAVSHWPNQKPLIVLSDHLSRRQFGEDQLAPLFEDARCEAAAFSIHTQSGAAGDANATVHADAYAGWPSFTEIRNKWHLNDTKLNRLIKKKKIGTSKKGKGRRLNPTDVVRVERDHPELLIPQKPESPPLPAGHPPKAKGRYRCNDCGAELERKPCPKCAVPTKGYEKIPAA